MHTIQRIALGALLAVGASTASAQVAHADGFNGYVCEIGYSPFSQYGSFGGVAVQYRTAPACGGTAVGTAYLQSTGATDPGSPVYRFAEKAFHQLWNILAKGATAEASVRIFGFCESGTCQIRSVQLRPL